MPHLLVVVAAIIIAVGFAKAKARGSCRPSKVPWVPLLVWAILLVTGISIWVSSARIG